MLQMKEGEIGLAGGPLATTTIQGIAKIIGTLVDKHQPLARGQVVYQLGLRHQSAAVQPIIIQIQRSLVGKVLIVMANPLADTSQHHGPRFWQTGFQQYVGAVVGEVESFGLLQIVGAKVHASLVDDQ